MAALRSALYAATFYPLTFLWVVIGVPLSLLGRRPTRAVVLGWVEMHHKLVRSVLGIRFRVEGAIPGEPMLLEFFQSAYDRAADLAHWDRADLEREPVAPR